MGVKERKTYNLDSGVVKAFEHVAKKRGQKYSELLEEILEHYIAKDGEMFADDIMAPRLEYTINQAVKKETNRLASMIYKNQIETSAILTGIPALYKKMLQGVEESIRQHVNGELLNQVKGADPDNPYEGIDFLYSSFSNRADGKRMMEVLRKEAANEYHEIKRKEKAAAAKQDS